MRLWAMGKALYYSMVLRFGTAERHPMILAKSLDFAIMELANMERRAVNRAKSYEQRGIALSMHDNIALRAVAQWALDTRDLELQAANRYRETRESALRTRERFIAVELRAALVRERMVRCKNAG